MTLATQAPESQTPDAATLPADDAPEPISAYEWQALSMAERRALAAEPDASEAMKEAAAVPVEDPDAMPEGEAAPAALDPAIQAAIDAALAAKAEPASPEPTPAPAAQPDAPPAVPQGQQGPDLATVQAQIAAAKAERDALMDRWDNLDENLTRDAFKAEMDRLAQVEAALLVQAATATAVQEQANQVWDDAVSKVMDAYGLHDDAHFEGFDAVLKAADAEFAGKLTDAQIIDKAVQRYAVIAHGMGRPIVLKEGAQVAPVAETPPPAAPAASDKPKPAPVQLPPTLAHIPAQSADGPGNDKFAHIEAAVNSNDPRIAEKAMALLSEDQFDEFMRSRR